jgi:hypothetical protein
MVLKAIELCKFTYIYASTSLTHIRQALTWVRVHLIADTAQDPNIRRTNPPACLNQCPRLNSPISDSAESGVWLNQYPAQSVTSNTAPRHGQRAYSRKYPMNWVWICKLNSSTDRNAVSSLCQAITGTGITPCARPMTGLINYWHVSTLVNTPWTGTGLRLMIIRSEPTSNRNNDECNKDDDNDDNLMMKMVMWLHQIVI